MQYRRTDESRARSAIKGVPAEQAAEERRLLRLGLTIKEVAASVGASPRRLEERNRLVYRIDVRAAFAERSRRDGVPDRSPRDPSFGHWFSGLFDGEGHFLIDLRHPRPGRGHDLHLGLNIYLRDDDAGVLRRVHEVLGGRFVPTSDRNVAYWALRGIADLAEIAVPLFCRYPLFSKKAVEFELFRALVLNRYVATLGGKRRRVPIGNIDGIERAVANLRARRRYAGRSSWAVMGPEP